MFERATKDHISSITSILKKHFPEQYDVLKEKYELKHNDVLKEKYELKHNDAKETQEENEEIIENV